MQSIQAANLDALLLSGDISEAEDVCWQLERLQHETQLPIMFVLGNHDFYHGSIAGVTASVRSLCEANPNLIYLSGAAPKPLVEGWTLCGDDGWADARLGNYYLSPVRMNDFRLIDELKHLDSASRKRCLGRLGTLSAMRLNRQLQTAKAMSTRHLVVTHIPPFRESCWYEDSISDDDWAPFFTCHQVGRTLRRFCHENRGHEVLVLCGHTHHPGRAEIAPNLYVWTGGAEYGEPRISDIIDLHAIEMRTTGRGEQDN